MTDVEVPDDALIGGVGEGFRTLMRNFDFTRPLLALTAIGCAQASVDEAVEHAGHREVFGTTLSRFEGVSFPLVEHTVQLEMAEDAVLPRAVEAGQRHRRTPRTPRWRNGSARWRRPGRFTTAC